MKNYHKRYTNNNEKLIQSKRTTDLINKLAFQFVQLLILIIAIIVLNNTYNFFIQENKALIIVQANLPTQQVRPFDQYLYTWWTDHSDLSRNRRKNLAQMKINKLNFIFVNLDNLQHFILEDFPLHPAFQNISAIQKGDYLKAYFMHFYGGAYSDLKKILGSYISPRDKLRQNIDLMGVGYYQKHSWDIAVDQKDTQFINYLETDNHYSKYIGNGCYIFRPMQEFTLEWYNRMYAKMQQKQQDLKKYPAIMSRQHQTKQYPYPLRWGQLNGQIFAKVQYKYPGLVSDGVPYVHINDYR